MKYTEPKIMIETVLRPCLVSQNENGKISERRAALFHKWIDKEEIILKVNVFCGSDYLNKVLNDFHKKNVIPNDVEIIKHIRTFGLVEYYDGTVAEVEPTRIKFVDNKTGEYAF